MRIVEFSLARRVTISMAALAVLLFGAVAFSRLPVNLLPDLSYPSLTIETELPGAAPAEVETLISRPVEEVVGVVAGVRRLSSTSRPGLSQVTLEFEWSRDMDFAALDVRQKLDLVSIPREASKPVLLRFDPANDPVLRLYLTGVDDLYQLRYVAEEILKKDLESTDGVAAIKVHGGFEEEIEVRIDQGKLSLLGLGVLEVNRRLAEENVNQAGGSLYEKEARYLVRADNRFQGLEDIMATVLVAREGRNVTLADVARIERGHKPREVITRFRGAEAVELAIYKEGDANTVQVAKAVQSRLERVKEELPAGIEAVTGIDQSRFIQASIREVLEAGGMGGLIAIVILLLFLRDPRSTLIIAASIPISVVATFFLMYRTGTSLNIMSLGGLALGVGMLVDNAIVVLESIFKRREAGLSRRESALRGTSDVGRAVVASTLTTVAVFLPVVFLEGIAAQLFRDMALTVSFSLLASLAVSLTLIPMLAALGSGSERAVGQAKVVASASRTRRVFRATLVTWPSWILFGVRFVLRWIGLGLAWLARPVAALFDGLLGALERAYPRVLRLALASPVVVVLVALLVFAGALALVPGLGFDLIPSFSQGEFSFRVQLPEGTPLEITDRTVKEVGDVLGEETRVASFSSMAGGRGLSLTNTGTEGENVARIQVRMEPGSTSEDEEAVAAVLRGRLEALEVANFEFERPSYFSFRTPIEVEIYGDDLGELHEVATAFHQQLTEIPGLVDLRSSAELGNPELQVAFQRQQLARLGLDLAQVAGTVRNKLQGEVATRFSQGDREIDIVVRSVEQGRASIDDVSSMIVGQRDGVPIFLKSVAEVEVAQGPTEIRRIGQKRTAVVSGNLAGRDMAAVAADAREILARGALPAGVVASLSGQEEERSRSQRSLMLAMALAIFLVYLVMASQFESFLHPLVVILTVPLGAVGVIAALALTGRSLNVVAMIGAVMLAGIVVNNAIVLVDAVNQRRRAGASREEALLQAGRDRFRPILMTSATTVLGLLPMAIGLGEGAELRAPMAITVIGGLTMATVLTLLVIPVMYQLFDRAAEALGAGEEKRTAAKRSEGLAGSTGGAPLGTTGTAPGTGAPLGEVGA